MFKIEPHPYPFNDRKIETSTENLFLKYKDIIFSDKETLTTPPGSMESYWMTKVATTTCTPETPKTMG